MKIILAYKSLKIPQNIGYFKILNGLALSAKKKKKKCRIVYSSNIINIITYNVLSIRCGSTSKQGRLS